MPEPIKDESFAGLRDIQRFCGENSASKGFREEGKSLTTLVNILTMSATEPSEQAFVTTLEASYFSKRLNLIHDELAEAHEELRNGKKPNERYLNTSTGKEGKPEGIPSELADVVIRVLDLCDEFHIDLADVILEKLTYNSSREAMHGRKF